MARVTAEVRERRRASKMAAILRGMAMAVIVDHALEAAELLRVNIGKRGAPFTISDVLMAELAVARDIKHMSYLELEGYVQKITGGLCTITAPQLCRRINALEIREVDGVLRVGEFDVLVRERGGVPEVSARRRRRRGAAARRGTTVAHRGGMAVITAGPGRRPEPGAAIDATFLSTGNRSAGRLEKWGREVGRRDNHKLTAAVGTRTRRILVAVLTNDRTGDSAAFGPAVGELKRTGALRGRNGERPPVHGDGAYSSRKNFAIAREAGCRLCAPIRITDSGRSNGTEGWHEEAAWQLAGARGAAARGVDVGRVRRKDRLAFREDWKVDVGQSIRSMVEYVFSTFKRTLGGHVAARKWENAVKEVARKVAIYNALLAAAGGA